MTQLNAFELISQKMYTSITKARDELQTFIIQEWMVRILSRNEFFEIDINSTAIATGTQFTFIRYSGPHQCNARKLLPLK